MTKPKPWSWVRDGRGGWLLLDGRRLLRANVWDNGTWHTYDKDGIGGENDVCVGPHKVQDARDQVMAAVVRQGWTPWDVSHSQG